MNQKKMLKKKKKKLLQTRKQRNEQYQKNYLMRELKLTEDTPVRKPCYLILLLVIIFHRGSRKKSWSLLQPKMEGWRWRGDFVFWGQSPSMDPMNISGQVLALPPRSSPMLWSGTESLGCDQAWVSKGGRWCCRSGCSNWGSGLVHVKDTWKLLLHLAPSCHTHPRPSAF